MKCMECEHFNVLYEPYRSGGILWDTGRAECDKHNLVYDYTAKKQRKRLVCVEASTEGEASKIKPQIVDKLPKEWYDPSEDELYK